jgi:hypothetical protein
MILTEEQKTEIEQAHEEWRKSVEPSLPEEMSDLFDEVKLFERGFFNAEQLCRSVEIQKKVQNLQSIALPKFLGYLNYSKYFKGFTGSVEDCKKEHPELQVPGGTGVG